MQGDVERHRRESDDAEIAAAVERIRARAAEVKILELDWQVLKVDRNAGRPRDFVTSGGSFRKKPGLGTTMVRRPSLRSAVRAARLLPVLLAEQVRHHLDAGIAGVVQARQPKGPLDRLQQREAGVVGSALHAVGVVVVGIDGEHDPVLVL